MRILHVGRYGSVKGGAETYLFSIAAAQARAGHEVNLAYGLDHDTELPSWRVPALGRSGEAEPPPDGADALQGAIEAIRPDLVHVHVPDAPWVAPFCARHVPTVLAVHDHRLHCPTGTKYWTAWRRACTVDPGLRCLGYNVVARCGSLKANASLRPYKAWRHANAAARGVPIQTFSRWIAEALHGAGIDPATVTVTPYPVPPLHDPAPVEDPDRRPVVLAPGRLNKEKGFAQLIDALYAVRTPVHLVLPGAGYERPALERRARNAVGGHRVTFPGWVSAGALAGWYARAAVVAVPSMWPEPFGIVGLEAMARGVPVVAFDSGGVSEWLTPDAGVLVPPGDTTALGKAISALVDDPAARERLGAGGRARSAAFSMETHMAALDRLYERVRAGAS